MNCHTRKCGELSQPVIPVSDLTEIEINFGYKLGKRLWEIEQTNKVELQGSSSPVAHIKFNIKS